MGESEQAGRKAVAQTGAAALTPAAAVSEEDQRTQVDEESDVEMLLDGVGELSGAARRQLETNLAAIAAKRARVVPLVEDFFSGTRSRT